MVFLCVECYALPGVAVSFFVQQAPEQGNGNPFIWDGDKGLSYGAVQGLII